MNAVQKKRIKYSFISFDFYFIIDIMQKLNKKFTFEKKLRQFSIEVAS